MLEKINLTNFQAHKKTELTFSDGVNVIKGESHSGKSSIMRAFKWVLFNRPQGDSFKKHGEKKVEVSILFDKIFKVTRKRDKKSNQYITPFDSLDAVKTDVPETVKTITKIDEINYQSQFDGYFLLQDTSGNIAKKLNKIVGLSIIDTSLSLIHQKEKQAKQNKQLVIDLINKLNNNIKELSWVTKAEKDVKKIEELEIAISDNKQHYDTLSNIVDSLTVLTQKAKEKEKWLKIEKRIKKINSLIDKYNDATNTHKTLANIIFKIKENQEILEETTTWLQVATYCDKIKQQIESYKTTKDLIFKLDDLLNKIDMFQSTIEKVEGSIKENREQRQQILNKYEVCPLCKQIIKKGTKHA